MDRKTPLSLNLLFLLVILLSNSLFGCSSKETSSQSSSSGSSTLTNSVSITSDSTYRYIQANGVPDHTYGPFPNANCPNSVSTQNYNFKVPLQPRKASAITYLELGKFGIGVNGVPFDPMAAEYWNDDSTSGWQYEAMGEAVNLGLDDSDAHVQPTGAYHYHGLSSGLVGTQSATVHSELVGYAADGFPIYSRYGYASSNDSSSAIKELHASYRLKSGTRPSGPGGTYDGSYVQDYEYVAGLGDLDECNGREGVTPEYPSGTYHYFMTAEFPYIPRCWAGTPDTTFTEGTGTQSLSTTSGNTYRHHRHRYHRHPH